MSCLPKKCIIHVDRDLNEFPGAVFRRVIKSWLVNPAEIHIIDVSMTTCLDTDHISILCEYIKTMREFGKEAILFAACDELKASLQAGNLIIDFHFIDAIEEAFPQSA